MYVITLARLGPASAMSRKNTTSPSAVQTTPSTAMAHNADAGIACGGVTKTAGERSSLGRGRLGGTRTHGARAGTRRVVESGGGGGSLGGCRTRWGSCV